MHVAECGSELDGVGEEVGQHLPQSVLVAHHVDVWQTLQVLSARLREDELLHRLQLSGVVNLLVVYAGLEGLHGGQYHRLE